MFNRTNSVWRRY